MRAAIFATKLLFCKYFVENSISPMRKPLEQTEVPENFPLQLQPDRIVLIGQDTPGTLS